MKAEKASTTLKIPLNERQHGIIERGAKKYGISMSKYVRLLSEDSNVLKKKDIEPYIEELDELTKNDPCLKVNKSAKKHVKKNMDCLKELVRDDKEVFTDETCERGSVHRTGVTFLVWFSKYFISRLNSMLSEYKSSDLHQKYTK